MSVDLEQLLHEDGKPTDALFPNVPRAVALVGHTVEQYKAKACNAHHQPLDENYYHGGVDGKLEKARRWLSKNYVEIVPVDQDLAKAASNGQ